MKYIGAIFQFLIMVAGIAFVLSFPSATFIPFIPFGVKWSFKMNFFVYFCTCFFGFGAMIFSMPRFMSRPHISLMLSLSLSGLVYYAMLSFFG